jgi:RNA polymerase sigma-70 factor (ECF subfamily)
MGSARSAQPCLAAPQSTAMARSGAEASGAAAALARAAGLDRAMPGPSAGDARLVRRAQRGSGEALEALIRRHWPAAHRAAYLVIGDATAAEDVAQEALVAAIRSLDRFDLRRPFGPWLRRIAVNRAIDHARARAVRGEISSGTAEEAERRGGNQPVPDSPGDPRSERLASALAALSPEHRAIVAMRFLMEMGPGEIAAGLGLPRGTVNSRLRRALDQLAEEIGRDA